jgi:hypothetical protein
MYAKYMALGLFFGLMAAALAADVRAPYLSGSLVVGQSVCGTSDGLGVVDCGSTVGLARSSASWTVGMNLAAADIPLFRVGAAGATITGINCRPEVLMGAAGTIQVFMAVDATTLSGGTRLDTTACDANSGVHTNQNMGVAVSAVTANAWVGIHATGTWTSSVGAGAIQIGFKQ